MATRQVDRSFAVGDYVYRADLGGEGIIKVVAPANLDGIYEVEFVGSVRTEFGVPFNGTRWCSAEHLIRSTERKWAAAAAMRALGVQR